jgi:hypothetical protein
VRYVVGVLVTLYYVAVSMGAILIVGDLASVVNRETPLLACMWLIFGVVIFLWWFIYSAGKAALNLFDMITNKGYDA